MSFSDKPLLSLTHILFSALHNRSSVRSREDENEEGHTLRAKEWPRGIVIYFTCELLMAGRTGAARARTEKFRPLANYRVRLFPQPGRLYLLGVGFFFPSRCGYHCGIYKQDDGYQRCICTQPWEETRVCSKSFTTIYISSFGERARSCA